MNFFHVCICFLMKCLFIRSNTLQSIHQEPNTFTYTRVASHLFTGGFVGIGKLPALFGWYIRYGIEEICAYWRDSMAGTEGD